MPRSIDERGLLKPGEVAKLQRVFDDACAARNALPNSHEARDIALNILALHNAGMQDEDDLIAAVSFRIDSSTG